MFDLNLMLTVATLLLVAVTWITDYFQWRSIRSVDAFLSGSRDVGEQFGDYLMEKNKLEDGTEVTNLQIMAVDVGRTIAHSFSMAAKGITSGDVREQRGVQKKMMEALKDPDVNRLLEFCDQAGIDRGLADIVLNLAQRSGHLDKILKNNGGGSGSTSW